MDGIYIPGLGDITTEQLREDIQELGVGYASFRLYIRGIRDGEEVVRRLTEAGVDPVAAELELMHMFDEDGGDGE